MPQGQYPSILAGMDITAALLLGLAPLFADKTADTSRTSTTALTADPDLSIAIPSAGTYFLNGYLNYEGGTGGSSDINVQFSSVGTLRYHMPYQGAGGSANVGNTNVGGTQVAMRTQGAGVLCGTQIAGSVITGSSGTITLNWAQNTSSGTATILHAGSWIELQRRA